MRNYGHVVAFVSEQPWAILPSKLGEIRAALDRIIAGEELSDEEIAAIVAARPQRPSPQAGAAVAVLPLHGTIAHRMGSLAESSGGISTERFGAMLGQALADPAVSAVVIDVDSPGGTVSGVPELADQIAAAARGAKPVVAVVDGLGASAAYWLASQAAEVVATPSAQVGSIGVIAAHQDVSKAMEMRGVKTTFITYGRNKAEGNPYAPLSEDTLAHLQEQINHYGAMFDRAVARGRSVPVARVRESFGQGRVFNAEQARRLGMIDRVGSLSQVVTELAAGKWSPPAPLDPRGGSWDDVVASPEVAGEADHPSTQPDEADHRRRRLRLAALGVRTGVLTEVVATP